MEATGLLQNNLSYSGYLVAIGVLVFTIWVILANFSRKQLKLPPGPRGWPLMGHLPVFFQLQVTKSSGYYFTRMTRRYGDIYMLKLGSMPMYILSNRDHARIVYGSSHVVGREIPAAYPIAIGPEAKGVTFSMGPEWVALRRFTLGVLRELGVGRGVFAKNIQREITRFVKKLDESSGNPQKNVFGLSMGAISNIMCDITFGNVSDNDPNDSQVILRIMEDFSRYIGPATIVLNSGVLCSLPFGPGKRLVNVMAEFRSNVESKIRKAKAMMETDESVNHYLKAFLFEMEKGTEYFNEDNLITCCAEMFFAGTETTAASLTWSILFLATHPDVQAKCQQELDEYVKEQGMPIYADRTKLPYLQATMLESDRLGTVTPAYPPHIVVEDTQLLGYDFPKGAGVTFNSDAMNMNPEEFPEPDQFRPERFLEDGQFKPHPDILPFSLGRRACPGEQLAKMELFLFMVAILRRYTITVPGDAEPPDFTTGVYGLVRSPLPFTVIISKREKSLD